MENKADKWGRVIAKMEKQGVLSIKDVFVT